MRAVLAAYVRLAVALTKLLQLSLLSMGLGSRMAQLWITLDAAIIDLAIVVAADRVRFAPLGAA